ncbi:hypothetical protein HK101_007109, partial [Irineochytrium annulatum]
MLIMAVAYFDPDPRSRSIEARPLPVVEKNEMIGRTFAVLLIQFVGPYSAGTVALAVCLVTSINVRKLYQYLPLAWASLIAAVIDFTGNDPNDTPFFTFLVGLIPLFVGQFFLFNYLYKFAISRDRLKAALEKVKVEEIEGQSKAAALISELRIRKIFDVILLTRCVWVDMSPENVELVEALFQYAIEFFIPQDEASRRAKRTQKKTKKKIPLAAYLLEQYGVFLEVCKEDFTISQLYFK